MKKVSHSKGARRGFTLIELLIVIAIILILIAIALPNFLAAQARAKVVRESADQRTIGTAIESLRVDRGVLLVDFWDDDDSLIVLARLGRGCGEQPSGVPGLSGPPTFFACCCWQAHNRRGGTSGMFLPLTTPIAYLQEVPRDPFAFEEGDLALIPEDVYPPISYMYHDRETKDENLEASFFGTGDTWRGVPDVYRNPPAFHLGIIKPLSIDHYILVGFGPDLERHHAQPFPYSATNGVKSFGDVIYRSDGGI